MILTWHNPGKRLRFPGASLAGSGAGQSQAPAETNIFVSTDLTSDAWNTTNLTATAAVEQTSEGPLSELTPTGLAVTHEIETDPIDFTLGTDYTASLVVKTSSVAHMDLRLSTGAFASGVEASINLATQAVNQLGSASPTTTVTDLGSNLTRVTMRQAATATAQSRLRIRVLNLLFVSLFSPVSEKIRVGNVRIFR